MMIDPDNETHNDYHEPVKGSASAKTIPELQQNEANFFYHDIPLVVEGRLQLPLPFRNQRLFFQSKGVGGCPDKCLTCIDFLD